MASNAGATSGASAIVEIGKQTSADSTYAAVLPRLLQAWTGGASSDAVSSLIAANSTAGDVAHRMGGLGAALLAGYKGEAGSYRQSLLSFNGVPGSAAAEQAQQVADLELQAMPSQKIALTLKTQSGATVELRISSRANGLGVELKTSQALSDRELKAVQALADGFETAVKGLTDQPPHIDIEALSRFDGRAITSLDLNVDFSKDGGDPLSLAFSATATNRKLSVETQSGVIDLSVDLSNGQILGNQAQRDKALSNYLSQVDVAAKRGNGDKALVALFKNAFSEMHAYYPDTATQTLPRVLRDHEAAVLSGLADFTANIRANAVASNPMRLGEVDSFEYRTVQESTLAIGTSGIRLSQSQQATLNASFHRELLSDKVPVLTADPRSQNYRYIQVNDSISARVSLERNDQGLLHADLAKSSSKLTNTQTYVRGKLTKDEAQPEQHSSIIDLLDSLRNLGLDPDKRRLNALNDQVLLKA